MILAVCILALILGIHGGRPDGDSGFFLKAPKSVPRAGRSAPGQYDGFFLKASKSVPRVGRRDGNNVNEPADVYQNFFDNTKLVTPSIEESLEDIYVGQNYPGFESDNMEGDLPHRTRRYNMASYLNGRIKGQENMLPYTNGFLNQNDNSHYQVDV